MSIEDILLMLNEQNQKIADLHNEIIELKESLRQIIRYAGNPNAADGCRLIIKEAKKYI